jgi:transcriptional regulator with XRE-family HTH domain
MHDETTIGPRLRQLRKWRKLTLVELAGQAGMSKSHLSDVERGLAALDRRSYIAGLASALQVSETEIVGGPHLSSDPVQAGPHAGVPALRVALETNTLADATCERARPLPQLVAETSAIERLYRTCDYVNLWTRVSTVIDELHLHAVNPADEAAQQTALRTLVVVCNYATFGLKDLGYNDLAHICAGRATEAAAILDEPTYEGKAASQRLMTMPQEWDRVLTAAERATSVLQPHITDQLSTQVCGMLSLSAALAAAALHKWDIATDWLGEAAELAQRVPDEPMKNWASFSTTNVGVWGVTVAVEHGEAGRAVLERARAVDDRKLNPSRRSAFMADVGRGLARERHTRREAIAWLRQAEAIAPQRIRNNKPVRHSVEVLLSQARAEAGGRELRGMAARMGIPH